MTTYDFEDTTIFKLETEKDYLDKDIHYIEKYYKNLLKITKYIKNFKVFDYR